MKNKIYNQEVDGDFKLNGNTPSNSLRNSRKM